jgi:hypothetical protein
MAINCVMFPLCPVKYYFSSTPYSCIIPPDFSDRLNQPGWHHNLVLTFTSHPSLHLARREVWLRLGTITWQTH